MQVDCTAPPQGSLSPEAARPYLTAVYGHLCFRCGLEPSEERPKMDVDHIIPVARGGMNTFLNFQYLCGPCNSWKGTQIIDFRPGERRKIDAGLPIIPNEERVRKVAVKVSPQTVIPAPVVIDPAWKAMMPSVTNAVSAALNSDDDSVIEAAKDLLASSLRGEMSGYISQDPTQAARGLLTQLVTVLHIAMDSSVSLHRAVRQTERALQGWKESTALANEFIPGRPTVPETSTDMTEELIQVYRQRNRRERIIAFVGLYALLITALAVYFYIY